MTKERASRPGRRNTALLAAVVLTAIAARLSVDLPFTPVPQTVQTLAVLGAGVVLGCRGGAVAMAIYVTLGALGLPVFAGGAAGLEVLLGPTGGFLLGFVPGAAIAGWWIESDHARSIGRACLGMALAHAAILFCGWLRLSVSIGASEAWLAGVAPFVGGAIVKSTIAGLGGYFKNRASIRVG